MSMVAVVCYRCGRMVSSPLEASQLEQLTRVASLFGFTCDERGFAVCADGRCDSREKR